MKITPVKNPNVLDKKKSISHDGIILISFVNLPLINLRTVI